jgi:hypothetical protein
LFLFFGELGVSKSFPTTIFFIWFYSDDKASIYRFILFDDTFSLLFSKLSGDLFLTSILASVDFKISWLKTKSFYIH